MLKAEIKEVVADALEALHIAFDIITVEYPTDARFGDYATNVALVSAKKVGKNPMALAEEIVNELKTQNEKQKKFEKIEVAKPGFINFWVTDEVLVKEISENTIPQIGKGKKAIVEYSSPNIAKPFTI